MRELRLQDYTYSVVTGELYCRGVVANKVQDSNGYLIVKVNGNYVSAHRFIWFLVTGDWPINEIDHKNRVRTDNRWINLRLATKAQNAQNRAVHANNLLGVRGVRHRHDGFFEPRLMKDGRAIYLGIFRQLDDAVEARLKAEKEHFSHAS